jgi:hypothetical protein
MMWYVCKVPGMRDLGHVCTRVPDTKNGSNSHRKRWRKMIVSWRQAVLMRNRDTRHTMSNQGRHWTW